MLRQINSFRSDFEWNHVKKKFFNSIEEHYINK